MYKEYKRRPYNTATIAALEATMAKTETLLKRTREDLLSLKKDDSGPNSTWQDVPATRAEYCAQQFTQEQYDGGQHPQMYRGQAYGANL